MPISSKKYFSIKEGLVNLLSTYVAKVPRHSHLAQLKSSIVVLDFNINKVALVLQKKQLIVEPLQFLVKLKLLEELVDDAGFQFCLAYSGSHGE